MAVRRKWRDALFMGTVQATINGLRAVFRVWEWFAPPAKKQKLRAFREKMGAIERDKNDLPRKIDGASAEEALALSDAFQDRWDSLPDPVRESIIAKRDASRAKLRHMKEEGSALKAILIERGNDSQEAIDDLRDYIAEHPNSRAAYSYLGMVFQKRKQWEESLAAYRQAEQMELQNAAHEEDAHGISVALARLHIGDLLLEKGDLEVALAQYNFLLQNAPPDQSFPACYAYLKIGNLYQQLNQMTDARVAWKAAIKRDETGIVAKQARQKLKGRS